MKPIGHMNWNVKALAQSMQITVKEVNEYFQDGRRGSFLMELTLAKVLNGTLSSTGDSFDLTLSGTQKWEIRSLTTRISFANSNNKGKGRVFNEDNFLSKLDSIEGYIVTDLNNFPTVPYYKIDAEVVRTWYLNYKNKKKFSKGQVNETTDGAAEIPLLKMRKLIDQLI